MSNDFKDILTGKEAEIYLVQEARLKNDHIDCAAREIAQLTEEARHKDAEIERLKNENYMMTDQAVKFRDMCLEKNKLMSLAVEAIEEGEFLPQVKFSDILQRLREALK